MWNNVHGELLSQCLWNHGACGYHEILHFLSIPFLELTFSGSFSTPICWNSLFNNLIYYVISFALVLRPWSKLNMYSLICFLIFKNSGISFSAPNVHSIPFLCSHWCFLCSFLSFGALGAYQLHYSVHPDSFYLEIKNPLGANTVLRDGDSIADMMQHPQRALLAEVKDRVQWRNTRDTRPKPGESPLKERPVILDTEYRVNNGTNAWDWRHNVQRDLWVVWCCHPARPGVNEARVSLICWGYGLAKFT